MVSRTPPKLATAILKHLSTDDALAGDLREQYASGKSASWYWLQVLSLIIVGEPRHSVLVVRGVLVGLITFRVGRVVADPISDLVMGRWVLDWLIVHLGSHPFVMLWAVQLWMRPLQAATYLICGWVVAKTHQRSAPIVLSVVMALLLVRAALLTVQWLAHQWHTYGRIAYPGVEIAFTALPLLVLVGGWIAIRSEPRTQTA